MEADYRASCVDRRPQSAFESVRRRGNGRRRSDRHRS